MSVRVPIAMSLLCFFPLYYVETRAPEYLGFGWFGCLGYVFLMAYLVITGTKLR